MKAHFKNLNYFIKYRNYIKRFKNPRDGPEICDLYWRMKNHSDYYKKFYCVKTGDWWDIDKSDGLTLTKKNI